MFGCLLSNHITAVHMKPERLRIRLLHVRRNLMHGHSAWIPVERSYAGLSMRRPGRHRSEQPPSSIMNTHDSATNWAESNRSNDQLRKQQSSPWQAEWHPGKRQHGVETACRPDQRPDRAAMMCDGSQMPDQHARGCQSGADLSQPGIRDQVRSPPPPLSPAPLQGRSRPRIVACFNVQEPYLRTVVANSRSRVLHHIQCWTSLCLAAQAVGAAVCLQTVGEHPGATFGRVGGM